MEGGITMKRTMARSKGVVRTGRRSPGTGKPMRTPVVSANAKRKVGLSLERYTHTFP
jgi:hypothetical protein